MSKGLSFENLRSYKDSGVDLPDMSYVFNTPNSVKSGESRANDRRSGALGYHIFIII